ncbi:MAG: hypothetical protein AAB617_00175 [Patescibacteria group bacterium]
MKHYICTGGCEGVSPEKGVCQAPDCPKNGQPLEECNCADGTHGSSEDNTEKEEE